MASRSRAACCRMRSSASRLSVFRSSLFMAGDWSKRVSRIESLSMTGMPSSAPRRTANVDLPLAGSPDTTTNRCIAAPDLSTEVHAMA
jgi:hypothetical protein